MYCPQCGTQNPDRNRFCSNCGGSIAGQAPTLVGVPQQPQQQAVPAPTGPYSPTAVAPGTLRRAGSLLVATPGAQFPPYCVKCGQPAQKWLNKNFGWHNPWIYAIILINLIVYAIVSMIVTKRMRFSVPFCAQHYSRRRMLLTLGWIALASFIPVFVIILGLGDNSDDTAALAVLAMFGMIILSIVFFVMAGMTIRIQEITATETIFKGISPAFLQYVSEQTPAAMAAGIGSAQMR